MLVLFNACQKDSLSERVTPIYTDDISNDLRSSEPVQFEVWQQLDILQPDCNDPIMIKDTEYNDDEISKTSGCTGTYGLTGYVGQGFAEEYGRFLSIVELKFDANKNKVEGTIEFKFVAEGDMLVLKAVGEISRISTEEGTTLRVHVMHRKGTGRFQHVRFNGDLSILEADQIFDGDAIDYNATIYINGSFGK